MVRGSEDRLVEDRRPGWEPLADRGLGRSVAGRVLLGRDGRDVEGRGDAGEPGDPCERTVGRIVRDAVEAGWASMTSRTESPRSSSGEMGFTLRGHQLRSGEGGAEHPSERTTTCVSEGAQRANARMGANEAAAHGYRPRISMASATRLTASR